MATQSGGWGIPGVGADQTVSESEILWGGDQSRMALLYKSDLYSAAALDAGNTPTSVLRPGMIMGRVTSSGELEEWDADASDGTQDIAGILDVELRMTDYAGTTADRVMRNLVRGPVKARKLLIQGVAFVGHADEFLARRQLVAAGYTLDDDTFGFKAGQGDRYATVTGTADTLTTAENGSTIFYSSASAVAVTLPAIQAGLYYDLVRTGDEEFVISSGEGDNMIVGNDLSADSITYTTAGEHMGARVRIKCVYVATTLKWLPEVVNAPFGTAVGSVITISIAS